MLLQGMSTDAVDRRFGKTRDQTKIPGRRLDGVSHWRTLDHALPEPDEFADKRLLVARAVDSLFPTRGFRPGNRELRWKVIEVWRREGQFVDAIIEVERHTFLVVSDLVHEQVRQLPDRVA